MLLIVILLSEDSDDSSFSELILLLSSSIIISNPNSILILISLLPFGIILKENLKVSLSFKQIKFFWLIFDIIIFSFIFSILLYD